jgi:hypothetical protein
MTKTEGEGRCQTLFAQGCERAPWSAARCVFLGFLCLGGGVWCEAPPVPDMDDCPSPKLKVSADAAVEIKTKTLRVEAIIIFVSFIARTFHG